MSRPSPLLIAFAAAGLACQGKPLPAATCPIDAPVPAEVRAAFDLSPFYAKHVSAHGLPVVSSQKVPDAALCVASDVASRLLERRPELFERLVEKKIRLAVMARTEVTTDIPEHSDLAPKEYWDKRARGLGATLARPAVSAAEENVLCEGGDSYAGESILVHELSHAVFNIAVELYEPDARPRLEAAYASAIDAGTFADTYAATNADEYWAEGAQDWFDANLSSPSPNGIHNAIHTRAQLEAGDPRLSELLHEVFGDLPWRYRCP